MFESDSSLSLASGFHVARVINEYLGIRIHSRHVCSNHKVVPICLRLKIHPAFVGCCTLEVERNPVIQVWERSGSVSSKEYASLCPTLLSASSL